MQCDKVTFISFELRLLSSGQRCASTNFAALCGFDASKYAHAYDSSYNLRAKVMMCPLFAWWCVFSEEISDIPQNSTWLTLVIIMPAIHLSKLPRVSARKKAPAEYFSLSTRVNKSRTGYFYPSGYTNLQY